MQTATIVEVMGRELRALGQRYRNDWSDFDGRTLRSELDSLVMWSTQAMSGQTEEEFTQFSE